MGASTASNTWRAFAGANPQEIALECVELTNVDLAGADLTKAKLNHARLTRVDLDGAKLLKREPTTPGSPK